MILLGVVSHDSREAIIMTTLPEIESNYASAFHWDSWLLSGFRWNSNIQYFLRLVPLIIYILSNNFKDVTSAFKGFRPHALGGFLKRCKCLLVAFDHKEEKQHDQTTRSTTVVMKFILVFVFVFSFHVLTLLAKDIPHQDDSSKVLASNSESDLSVNYRVDPQNRRLPRGWLTRVQCA